MLDRRRRIDRILLHENFQNSVAECYSRFVASSDHKAVIASLSAKPTKQGKRLRIPTAFLSSEETLQQLQAELQSIDTEGYSKWADGMECIKTAAFSYAKANRATSITELQSLLMGSSIHHRSEEAWRYLKEHGYTPSSATVLGSRFWISLKLLCTTHTISNYGAAAKKCGDSPNSYSSNENYTLCAIGLASFCPTLNPWSLKLSPIGNKQ